MKKLVSVALATYNGDKYISKQLDSIFLQTYKDIEVVISDDASTDNTIEILERYKKKYNLRYSVNSQRLGFVKNFENAIQNCKGNYIALCDQDDIWLPEKLEVLINTIGDSPLICSDAIIIDENDNIISESLFTSSKMKFYENDQFRHIVFSNFVVGATCLFNAKLCEYLLPFPDKLLYHDWWIALVASSKSKIKYLSKPLIKYRFHGYNQTNTGQKFDKSIIKKINSVKKTLDDGSFQKKYKSLSKLKELNIFNHEQKTILNEACLIYRDLANGRFSLNILKRIFENRNYLFCKRSPLQRIILPLGYILMPILKKI